MTSAPFAGIRVVLVAKFNRRYHRIGISLAAALESLGAAVERVELRPGAADKWLGWNLARRLQSAVRRHRPDLVLSYKGGELARPIIDSVRPVSRALWVNWFPDSPHLLELSLRNGAAYDRCFLFDTSMVEHHRSLGRPAEFLPLGFDPEVFRPLSSPSPELPIVFVGTSEPMRDRALGAVADLGLTTFGPDRPGGARFGDELVRVYSRAQIALNVHQFFGEDPGRGRYGTGANQRVFELAGIGRVQLCDAKADIGKSFELDQEIVTFRSDAELRDKAQTLLSDPPLRQRIGERGRARALAEHTWRHRLDELLTRVLR